MPLEAEGWTISPRQALEGTVEERDMGRAQVPPDGGRIDGEAVVLAGDHHLPGVEVFHRMVGAVMAELHLQRLRARGKPHELVAKADAEDGDAGGVEDLADRFDGVVAR